MSAVHVVSETQVLRMFRLQDPSSEFSVTDSLNSLQYKIQARSSLSLTASTHYSTTFTNLQTLMHLSAIYNFTFLIIILHIGLATPIWFYVV